MIFLEVQVDFVGITNGIFKEFAYKELVFESLHITHSVSLHFE